MPVVSKDDIKVYFETGKIPTEAQYIDTIDSLAHVDKIELPLDIEPEIYPGLWRVKPESVFPGWSYTSVAGGSTSFQEIEVKPETAYVFEDCTHVFDNTNNLMFLNAAGHSFARYLGAATDTFITPRDCKKIVFSVSSSSLGAAFRFKELPDVEVQKFERTGVNLCDGSYHLRFKPAQSGSTFGFVSGFAATTGSIPVREGATYYYYNSLPLNGITDLAVGLDEDDNCVALIASEFSSFGVPDQFLPIVIPENLGIVKIMLIIGRNASNETEIDAGNVKFGLVEEKNHSIIDDFKEPSKSHSLVHTMNEVIDLREPIRKLFLDKNFFMLGDGIYSTETDAPNAYYENDVLAQSNQGTTRLRGGALSELIRRLRPGTWTNYSNAGWGMVYSGANFGNNIFSSGNDENYLYNLERFFEDYDDYIANPATHDPRYAPDIFMVAGSIVDYLGSPETFVTDTEIADSEKSYDQYMEDTFISSGSSNDTLIPLENINFNKAAGALRYIVERMYLKFPKCYIVLITPNKTTAHPRENQQKYVRDLIWMAERLNIQVIDVFNSGNQMIPLREFRDSVTGTRDQLYLSANGINPFGSSGKGDQRQGRFITNELVKAYFDLFDF